MFESIDASLQSFFKSALAKGVTVSTEPPGSIEAAAKKNGAVSMFLYAIEEDLDGRAYGFHPVLGENGRTVARLLPPRVYVLKYLVSAVAATLTQEHRILGSLVGLLAKHHSVPATFVSDELEKSKDLALTVGPAQPWLEHERVLPQLHINLLVRVSVPSLEITEIAPPAEEIAIAGGLGDRIPPPPQPAPPRPWKKAHVSEG